MDDLGKYRLGYRAHVEGLRAVAILLVVAAHAHVPGMSGGFVGVDVFFVISGYLISGLLIGEIRASGRISFRSFYARRANRLLPALLVCGVVTSLIAWLLIAPAQQPAQATAAIASILWVSNFHFLLDGLDYFSAGVESNLFLHTWSLAVEEQFYLLWPLLLAMATRLKAERLGYIPLFCFVIALSLPASVVLTYMRPEVAFYMMPTRAWQFAMGAIAFQIGDRPAATSAWPDTLISCLGIGAILSAATLLDGGEVYPGLWALLPTLGASAILVCSKSVLHEVLSSAPMQWLGRRSYGWYLWHWPVLLIGDLLADYRGGFMPLALSGSSLLLAAVSYRWIEEPIRRSAVLASKPKIALAGGLWLLLVAAFSAATWLSVAESKHEYTIQQELVSRFTRGEDSLKDKACGDTWRRNGMYSACAIGPLEGIGTAVLIGDSVAAQWSPAFGEIFDQAGWRLLVDTRFSCPMLDATFKAALLDRNLRFCNAWRNATLDAIAGIRPDLVVISSIDNYEFSRQDWIEGTRKVLSAIAPYSGRTILLRSTPVLPERVWGCRLPQTKLNELLSAQRLCTSPAHTAMSDDIYNWQREAASEFANVELIDLTDLICPGEECEISGTRAQAFSDPVHLAPQFVRTLTQPMIARMRLPAARPVADTRAMDAALR